MRCMNCHRMLEGAQDRCPYCGSRILAEELPSPPEVPPDEAWKTWPCRIVIQWSSVPSMPVLRTLSRSGPFASTSKDLLNRVRASNGLTSRSMTYGQAREWMQAHADSVSPGSAQIEVQTLHGDWEPVALWGA